MPWLRINCSTISSLLSANLGWMFEERHLVKWLGIILSALEVEKTLRTRTPLIRFDGTVIKALVLHAEDAEFDSRGVTKDLSPWSDSGVHLPS